MSGSEIILDPRFTRLRVKVTHTFPEGGQADRASIRQIQVRDVLQQFLNTCSTVDPQVGIAPWSTKDDDLPVRLPHATNPLPTHQERAKPYFHTINYFSKGYDTYFYIRLRHGIPMKVLLNLEIPHQLSIWIASLQSSNSPVKGGYFVYSLRAYSYSPSLFSAILSTVRLVAGKAIDLGLYWAPVNSATIRGPYALQFDVDEADYDLVKRCLTQIYNREKEYPLGVPMVYVPPISRCIDQDLIHAAFHSQAKFTECSELLSFRCFISTDLDGALPIKEVDRDTSQTLREVFHSIKVDQASGPVFHAVLECIDQTGTPYVLAVTKFRQDLAKLIYTSPVAFFRQYFTDEVLITLFDKAAVIQGQSETYDPLTRKVSNTDETASMAALQSSYYFDMQILHDRSQERHQRDQPMGFQGDNHSVASNFSRVSFDPGSVATRSALNKRVRMNVPVHQDQVPGALQRASGEGP